MNGRQTDVVETSRGCTFDCSFCSIIEMRGRNFHRFSIERVIEDIADAKTHGARSIFLVDDNIVLDVRRFTALCHAIIAAGLQTIDYTVQAMTSTIADHGAELAPLMRRAGFRYVFLGIENVLQQDLGFLKAESKNLKRVDGKRSGNAAIDAIRHIRGNSMFVVGGLIVGNPDDTRDDIEANLDFARRWIDWPYIQHPTPYPGTPMTADLRQRDLIAIDDVAQYDGTTAVVRCEHLELREVEYLRWRADRWMKVRHMPAMIRHDPLFSLRHGLALLAHTFRGHTWRTVLGLEPERRAFERYCARRAAERQYLRPSPLFGNEQPTQRLTQPGGGVVLPGAAVGEEDAVGLPVDQMSGGRGRIPAAEPDQLAQVDRRAPDRRERADQGAEGADGPGELRRLPVLDEVGEQQRPARAVE